MAIFAGTYGPSGLEYPDGRHAIGVYIPVYNEGTDELATLYVNEQKTGLAPNPVTTDAYGNLFFFAEPGAYDVEFADQRITVYVGFSGNEPVADETELGYKFIVPTPLAEWECPYPLKFQPAGFYVYVDGLGQTIAPITYGEDKIFVHHGAPCTGYVGMS